MLANGILKAFIPTVNPQEAILFYRDLLGFELMSEDDYAMEFNANGTLLRVTIVNEFVPQPFTILGWNIENLVFTVRQFNEKNIYFEIFDFLEQDDLGIWNSPGGAKVAWFKDPDGNILSLTELER
ncbi:MAG: VOC family protein [Saprospiraceae bacterium]|nr:VOC family protein [Saprospiraceae bacterium]HPG07651.1 VOC family protein [Saprospiraceae bacterium]